VRLLTHSDLARAQTWLRRDDPAIRLRFAAETPDVLIERKTFRGRIGSVAPSGLEWPVDSGRRREEGHVLVASVPRRVFDAQAVRAALQAADTWRKWEHRSRPRHLDIEEAESRRKAERKFSRQQDTRYRVVEAWDRWAWSTGSRVSMAGL
jgi:hypothetical protein